MFLILSEPALSKQGLDLPQKAFLINNCFLQGGNLPISVYCISGKGTKVYIKGYKFGASPFKTCAPNSPLPPSSPRVGGLCCLRFHSTFFVLGQEHICSCLGLYPSVYFEVNPTPAVGHVRILNSQ